MPFLTTTQGTLHYQDLGQGEPLIVLGGLGDNTRNWLSIGQQLSKSLRVILLDHRCAGQSSCPTESFTVTDMADDVVALMDHLLLDTSTVLGFSMGGKVAMGLALEHPKRVNKLILVSTGPGWNEPYAPQPGALHILEHPEDSDAHTARQFEILYSPAYRAKFKPESFIKFKKMNPHPQSREAYLQQLHAIQAFDARDRLQQISCPTLILAGADDPIAPVAVAHWMDERIPDSKLEVFEQAGHILHGEETKRFVETISRFVNTNIP